MGTKLQAKFKGKCRECDTEFAVGEQIFYQKEPKIVCKNEECFHEQGGAITPFKPKSSFKSFSGTQPPQPQKKPFVSNYDRKVKIVLPETNVPTTVVKASSKLVGIITAANNLAEELYPDEPRDSQTFGQIRSKLADQLISLLK